MEKRTGNFYEERSCGMIQKLSAVKRSMEQYVSKPFYNEH